MLILRYIGLIFVLFIVFTGAKAQRATIDSLHAELGRHHEQNATRLEILNNLSYSYRESFPDSTISVGQQALELAEILEDSLQKAWSLNNIATGHWMKANYPTVLRYAQDALAIFQALGEKEGVAQMFNTLANTYNMEGDHDVALDYYYQSIKMYELIGDENNVARAYANIGRTHYIMGNYDSAMVYLNQVVAMKEEEPRTMMYAIVLNTTGDVYQKLGQYNRALQLYNQALQITDSLEIPRIITYSTRGISEVYQKNGDYEKSNAFALRTLNISRDIGYLENVKNASLILSDNYKSMGQMSRAYDYYVEYTVAKDSMFNQQKRQELQKLQANYEVQQREKTIELLQTENQVREKTSINQRLIIFGMLVSTLLILAIVVVQYRKNQLESQTNLVLSEQKRELSNRNQEIIKQREELIRQSNDLKAMSQVKDRILSIVTHDLRSPVQSLMALTSLLDNPDVSKKEMQDLKKNLDNKIDGVRQMIDNLLFWAKEQFQGVEKEREVIRLDEIIERNIHFLAAAASNKEIEVKKEFHDKMEVFGNTDQVDTIIRNLLNNAVKFTRTGGEITIGFHPLDQQYAKVFVKDNGIGINSEDQSRLFDSNFELQTKGTADEYGSGFGLFLCKQFVEENGGKIWVESEEGKGSTFIFTIPY